MAKGFKQSSPLLDELADAIDGRKPQKLASILKRGADVNAPLNGRNGSHSALQRAIKAGNAEAAILLLHAGARITAKEANLVWAIRARSPELVRAFISAGGDVNMKAPMGTPIDVAARAGQLEMVQMLIDAGADINAGSVSGTPLKHAIERDHTDVALLLISAGASLDPGFGTESLEDLAKGTRNKRIQEALKSARATPRRATARKKPTAGKPADESPYLQAVSELERLCGTPRQPMAGEGFTFHLHSSKRKSFKLLTVHAKFLKRGCYVYTTDATTSDRIAILPTTDRAHVMRTMATNGANHGHGPDEIIAWIDELETTHPVVLTGIGFDFLSGRFTKKVKDPNQLARRIVDFCPDAEDASLVAKQLRKSQELFLWWD